MKLDALLGIGKDLGPRFNLVGVTPTALLTVFLLSLVWGGAPDDAPSVERFADRVEALGATEAALLVLVILGVSLVAQPFQLPLVRLLEGYWGQSPIGRTLARPGTWFHRRRLSKLAREQVVPGGGSATPERTQRAKDAGWKLVRLYPPDPYVLPTRLGNVLRAAEYRAGGRYGLDTVAAWPRLYPLLSERVAAIVDDQRDQLDLAVKFAVVFAVGAVASAALVASHGWYLLIPAGALAGAWFSYRGAVGAALAYGEGLKTAFDLHRFDLLRALQIPLPADARAERAENERLSMFLRGQDVELNAVYRPGDASSRDSDAPSPQPDVSAHHPENAVAGSNSSFLRRLLRL